MGTMGQNQAHMGSVWLYRSFTYLLPYLIASLRIGPFRLQAGGRKRRPNLAGVFCVFLHYSIFCYRCIFAFVVLGLVSRY